MISILHKDKKKRSHHLAAPKEAVDVFCLSVGFINPPFIPWGIEGGSRRTRKGRRKGRGRMNNRIREHGGGEINRTVAAFQKEAVTS